MKHFALLLLTFLAAGNAFAQGTLIHRTETARGSEPYHATAILSDSGWEFWAFGLPRYEALDLEFGRLWPVGDKFYAGGYAVYWPDPKMWFAMPWIYFADTVGGGSLSVNLAAYVPVNNGPTILFSDETALVWKSSPSLDIGVAGNWWAPDNGPDRIRFGPTARLALGKTNVKLSYQPFYLQGSGKPVFRIQVSTRF